MMKLKYILGSLLAAVFCLTSCQKDEVIGTNGTVSADESFVVIPATGGDATVTINAAGEWKFDDIFSLSVTIDGVKQTKYFPLPVKLNKEKTDGELSWLSVSALQGSGTTQITFHADGSDGGRECELRLTIDGKKQFLKVRQGSMEAVPSTCAEVIAGPDAKTYRVTGTVTAIANTTYGNWYLEDGTGQVYIYGTLDKNGATKNFSSLGIEVGDVVTVEGPKTTYNGTVELVDVTVIKIVKSLIKVVSDEPTIGKEGGNFEVKVAYKGNGTNLSIPAEAESWLHMTKSTYKAGVKTIYDTAAPADTTIYQFTVDANAAEARTAVIDFSSANSSSSSTVSFTVKQEANVLPHGQNPEDPFTVAEAIAKCKAIGSTSDGVIYYAKGIISSISSIDTGNYGNATFNISDDGTDANAITCFRSFFLENAKFTAADQIGVGDEVIITGKLVNYKGETPEFSGNVYIYKHTKATNDPGSKAKPFTPAEANAFCKTLTPGNPADDAPDYYVKGKIVKYASSGEYGTKYGNASFYISVDGQESSEQFYVFRTLYFGNKKYDNDADVKPAVGDEVVICGKLMLYKKSDTELIPETAANKSYLYSLNGKTSN